jgi:hypothetical protein
VHREFGWTSLARCFLLATSFLLRLVHSPQVCLIASLVPRPSLSDGSLCCRMPMQPVRASVWEKGAAHKTPTPMLPSINPKRPS